MPKKINLLLKNVPLKPMPEWVDPMKATLTEDRFSHKDWQFEPKLDGVRCLAYFQKGKVQLFSRRQLSMNSTYPEVVDSLEKQNLKSFILDGEIVAFRPQSTVTSFEVLQERIGIHNVAEARGSQVRVFLYAFDLLYADGHDLRSLPLTARQEALKDLLSFDNTLRYTTHLVDQGESYFKEACRNGWEGLIAKRRESHYQSGRSHEWLKFKCIKEQEFVIGGYSDPDGAREHFGALLLGHYQNGLLQYAGKVGTGFNSALLQKISSELKKIEQPSCPFQSIDIPRRALHWVKPVLVAQIGFAEWTKEGKLRQARFVGMRDDKEAKEVVREIPAI